jgi:carbonic anhydrase
VLQSLLCCDLSTLLVVGSDSRVPESVVLDSKTPGEIFVHRNIANTFRGTDDSCHSVLEYGVEHLGIRHGTCGILQLIFVYRSLTLTSLVLGGVVNLAVVVVGHTACGGCAAAFKSDPPITEIEKVRHFTSAFPRLP